MLFPDFSNSEISPLRRQRVIQNIQVRKISSAPFPVVSLQTVAQHLKLDMAENPEAGQVTDEDPTLTMLIAATTKWWEDHMGVELLRATWQHTQDAIKDGSIDIRRGPLLSVVSVSTIAGFTPSTSTPVVMDDELYCVAGNSIVADVWPVHRGRASVIVTYQGGLFNWELADEDAPTPEEVEAIQAALQERYPDAILGILNAIGHLYENREGQKPLSKYEVDTKLAGLTPPNTSMLGTGTTNWSLTGKCWF